MTHASTLITPTAKSCLLGDQAAACFFHLASGESRSRNYRFARGNEYGYYYEPRIRKWITFDNRMGTFYVEICDTDREAEQLLTGGNGLLAA